jgi:hypothetical protein
MLDGVFDGKDGSGKQVTIGTGSKQIVMPADSITTLLLPAIKAFFAEGGTLNIGQTFISSSNQPIAIPTTALSQIQFLDSIPIIFPSNDSFTIGGTVSDLYTTGLVLQNNAGEEISVSPSSGASRTFAFNTKVKTFAVTVKTQPIATTCSVTNGSGTANSDISNVSVSCLTFIGNVLKPLNNLTNTSTVFAGPVAGTTTGGTVDGTGPSVRFNTPIGVTTDGTNLYVTDSTLVRKIVIATGEVSTLATGFSAPTGITIVGPNLYVSGYGNHQVFRVVIATGAVTSIAGSTSGFANGIGAAAQFNQPEGITTDGTDLYLADLANFRIRKIEIATNNVTTIAGSGVSGFNDATGTSAQFTNPYGITCDGTNLYVSDAHRIRKIVIATGAVTTVAGSTAAFADGTGAGAQFGSTTRGILTDGTNLYIGASDHHLIRKIVISTGVVTTIAGLTPPGAGADVDGTGSVARFNQPRFLSSDGTSLYIPLTSANKIRRLQ